MVKGMFLKIILKTGAGKCILIRIQAVADFHAAYRNACICKKNTEMTFSMVLNLAKSHHFNVFAI